MNYLPSETAEKVFAKLDELEKKVNTLVTRDDEWYKTLRRDVMKTISDLREEIVETSSKFERERQRKAKAIKHLKSE